MDNRNSYILIWYVQELCVTRYYGHIYIFKGVRIEIN